MFYLLATALCLAVVFIVAAASSFISALALWAGRRWLLLLGPGARANLLFMLRTLPLLLAVVTTLCFVLPAFLLFEPRSSGEIVGWRLFTLAALGGLAIGAVAVRSCQILQATHRAQRQWQLRSRPLHVNGISLPVYCGGDPLPLVAVTGLFRPQIFVSTKVLETLSRDELFAAIAHEIAHVSAWDNLKQLVLKATSTPKWFRRSSSSDAWWLNTSEIVADEGALDRGASALDLASALVKVAGLSRLLPSDQMVASHLLPATATSSMESRINHLRELLEKKRPAKSVAGTRSYWLDLSLLALLVAYAAGINLILPWMHELLETLVR